MTTASRGRVRLLGAALALFAADDAGAANATPPPIMAPPSSAAPAAASAGIVVSGPNGRTLTIGAAELARMPREHLSLTHMGRTSDYAGPLLADVLRRVGAPLGAQLRGPAVGDVVVLTASDGYVVALSLGEIDPETHRGARAILADEEDGRPLPPNEAPARLVIDGEVKPARDVHSIGRIEVKRLP